MPLKPDLAIYANQRQQAPEKRTPKARILLHPSLRAFQTSTRPHEELMLVEASAPEFVPAPVGEVSKVGNQAAPI